LQQALLDRDHVQNVSTKIAVFYKSYVGAIKALHHSEFDIFLLLINFKPITSAVYRHQSLIGYDN